jgi:hypothetical protein
MSVVMTCDGVMSEGHVVWEWGFEGVLNVVYVPHSCQKGILVPSPFDVAQRQRCAVRDPWIRRGT